MRADTPITLVHAAAFRVPTDGPEADGTLAWDSTVIVVVNAEAGGMSGLGYTYGATEGASLINATLAPILSGKDVWHIPSAHQCNVTGCSTDAKQSKQSALVTWIPRAAAAGAEIRDFAMAGRIEVDAAGRAVGVHYFREGVWRFQRARNRVVVVIGGSAGVGRATVEAFARAGWDVGIIARDPGRLERAAEAVCAAGRSACIVSADVADATAVEDGAARIEEALGPIDVWVNNAMATAFAPVAIALTPEEMLRATQVTYLGQVHGTMAALRRMRDRNPARSSMSGRRWRTARSRCSRPIAPRSSPFEVLPTRCVRSCCMTDCGCI
jgi:hypothetical protein